MAAYGTTTQTRMTLYGHAAFLGNAMRFLSSLLCVLALAAGIVLSPVPGYAAGYQVGFRTIGQWQVENALRLDVNIWYPSIRAPRELDYPPWTIEAARGGKPVEGRFPVIVLSHASPGARFSYHQTAAWLAMHGFVVAAPTHAVDSMYNMDALFTWRQFRTRATDISTTLNILQKSPDLAPMADMSRVGVIGYGAGGLAALLTGGALPDCGSRDMYCANVERQDMYCNPWAAEKLDTLCAQLPLRKSLADTRVKAVAAVSPAFSLLLSQKSLRQYFPPTLLIAGGAEVEDRPDTIRMLASWFPRSVEVLQIDDADTGAFMSPCPPVLLEDLPELCGSVTPDERAQILDTLHSALLAFFLRHLGDEATSSVPLPPAPEAP